MISRDALLALVTELTAANARAKAEIERLSSELAIARTRETILLGRANAAARAAAEYRRVTEGASQPVAEFVPQDRA